MRLLLDSHALIWWLMDDHKLSVVADQAIRSANEVYVSAVSVWELTTKFRIGKLPEIGDLIHEFADALEQENFAILPLDFEAAHKAGLLPGPHRDPFDRMLIAQALIENLALVSNEEIFDQYGVKRIW